jgi:hypothetical protein
VYWEVDPDNGWSSAFFPCRTYIAELERDDRWASDFDDALVVRVPGQPAFAYLYAPSWDATREVAACNHYLIARSLAALGRAAEAVGTDSIPLYAGHHDQDRVFRLVAPSERDNAA